ncbi:MAG: hypothetical protein AVDCRST_MAG02-832, partial [uncultured Rubrobacteraceae bacterium]
EEDSADNGGDARIAGRDWRGGVGCDGVLPGRRQ